MKMFVILLCTIVVIFLLVDFFMVLLVESKNKKDTLQKHSEKTENKKITTSKILNSFNITNKNYVLPDIENLLDTNEEDESSSKIILDNIDKLNDFFSKKKLKCECINYFKNGIVSTFEIKIDNGQLIDDITKYKDEYSNIFNSDRVDFIIPFQTNTIGIIVKNDIIKEVNFKDSFLYLKSKNSKKKLLIELGKNLMGDYELFDIEEAHNIVIGGATGSGKSTFLQNIICNLISRNTPNDLRLICIDTKGNELFLYNDLEHSLCSSITDKDDAFKAMNEVLDEIYHRNDLLDVNMDRNIIEYNKEVDNWNKDHLLEEEKKDKLNYIVFVIDDFSELLNYKKAEFEKNLLVLGSMGPKVGVHLILSSRKPVAFSNIVKGVIETKISFKVNNDDESYAILGNNEAVNLYGVGDMYLLKKGSNEPTRIQSSKITVSDVKKIVNNINDINCKENKE